MRMRAPQVLLSLLLLTAVGSGAWLVFGEGEPMPWEAAPESAVSGAEDPTLEPASTVEPGEQPVEADPSLGGRSIQTSTRGDELPGVLQGVVVNASGATNPFAMVEAFPADQQGLPLVRVGTEEPALVARTRTGPHGSFVLQVPEDIPLDVVARAEGYGPAYRQSCFAGETLRIELRRAAVLEGSVRYSTEGLPPAAGVKVRILARDYRCVRELSSAADGSFRVEGLGSEPHWVQLMPVDAVPPPPIPIDLQPGQVTTWQFVLEIGSVLRSRVVDRATQEPIADAQVVDPRGGGREVCTDSEGRFGLHVRSSGVTPLTVHADGYATRSWSLRPDQELDLALDREAVVRGHVVDLAGDPLAGVSVTPVDLESGQALVAPVESESTGEYTVPELGPGARYALLFELPGWSTQSYVLDPQLVAGEARDLPPVQMQTAAVIDGRLVTVSGEGAPGRVVNLVSTEASFSVLNSRQSRTSPSGRFRFADLPAGSYTVFSSTEIGSEVERELTLATGQRLELTLRPDELDVISGQVRIQGVADDPPRNVVIQLLPEDGQKHEAKLQVPLGEFRFDGVPPGRYSLRVGPASGTGVWSAPVLGGVVAGSHGVDLILQPSQRIEGRVLSPDGTAPAVGMRVEAYRRFPRLRIGVAGSRMDGSFSLVVPAGTVCDLELVDRQGELFVAASDVTAGSVDVVLLAR